MLAELVEYLLTPCPPAARKLGYLSEAVAIRARHRRCRTAWESHLENSRAAILDAAKAGTDRKCALVLGSGALLDIPVEQLARMFDRVVLADVVHPLSARWRVRRLANVSLKTLDVTGVLDALAREPRIPPDSRDAPKALSALLRDLAPDLIVSANILSQLPLLPLRRLETAKTHTQRELDAFAARLVSRHISLLDACPGTACLIADIRWRGTAGLEDPLRGIALPPPARTWTWTVAPRPEVHRDRDVTHDVGVFMMGQSRAGVDAKSTSPALYAPCFRS